MTREDLSALLSGVSDAEFVDRHLLSGRPWIFENDAAHDAWRRSVGGSLGVALDDVRIVGSAATGYSLSPLKPGRPFRPWTASAVSVSDIDIALVDPRLFSDAWNLIISLDRAYRLGGTDESRGKIRFD